jgi:hypothetical protein
LICCTVFREKSSDVFSALNFAHRKVLWSLECPKDFNPNGCVLHEIENFEYSYSSSIIRKKLTFSENSFTTILDTAVLGSQCANCKQYNYELQGKGLIHDHAYTCNDNPKNIAAGYCILSFNDAVQHCDRDPECGGFDITTNVNYRNLFERNGLPSVQLFRKGSATSANVEWSSYLKTGSK